MPLYTVRIRWTLGGGLDRGADNAETNHHFEYPDDATAVGDIPRMALYTQTLTGQNRWVIARGDDVEHEISLYRRSSENRKSWEPLYSAAFTMAEWTTLGLPLPGDVSFLDLAQRPIFPHARGAVLVVAKTADPRVTKRTYCGPISPINLVTDTPFDIYTTKQFFPDILESNDLVWSEADDIDQWRTSIAEFAAEWCAGLGGGPEGVGVSVVPSWRWGVMLPVTEWRASLVRAEIRSRSIRAAMTAPITYEPPAGGGGSW